MKHLDKLIQELSQQQLEKKTRRHFLMDCVSKMGGLALAPLMFGCGLESKPKGLELSQRDLNPLAPLPPPFRGKPSPSSICIWQGRRPS